ncbi:hypothetical protein E2C01_071353 [Portunus trituberculatus]|uniref:Uncharacterized protein n=1 Tax=Portunus trituberculatus TaxID=210409 RepID=A0A5B7I601_PORTR|nr:hypothetical protein [Portunus trituberculatus]
MVTAMSSSGEESSGPSMGFPLGPRTSRNTHSQVRGSVSACGLPQPGSLWETNHSPGHGTLGPTGVNKLSTSPHLFSSQDAAPWEVVLTSLAELRDEVNKLKRTDCRLPSRRASLDGDLPEVAREVGVFNRALALLGNANYKNNLARRFAMKHKINHKCTHFCSSKVPVTCFQFVGAVSQSAKQIKVQKFIAKKLTSAWPLTETRPRGYRGSPYP